MFSRSSPPSFNISTLDDEAMFHGYKVLGLFDGLRWRSRSSNCCYIDRESCQSISRQSIAELLVDRVHYSVTQDFELEETHNLFLERCQSRRGSARRFSHDGQGRRRGSPLRSRKGNPTMCGIVAVKVSVGNRGRTPPML
jgi:hypothetical protein